MPGLFWLLQGSRIRGLPAGCMTFVRGTDKRLVLAGLGVDPDDVIRPDSPEFSSTPGFTVVRSGDWLVALESAAWPRGIRPDVLRRLSPGTEVVAIYEDIAKGNHEFAHAAGGEIITAVTTSVPPKWGGTQPDRLRPLAEELGMQYEDGTRNPDPQDYDLGDLAILLLIAEAAFGLSLDEADLNNPLLKVPDEPRASRRPVTAPPGVMHSEQVRSHVQRLIDGGVTADAIAARIGQPKPIMIDALLRGRDFWLGFDLAGQILAMQVPGDPASTAPVAVRSAQVRPHVQRLIDSGVTPEGIAARAGLQMTKNGTMNALIYGGHIWIMATTAERILAIEVPPNT